MLTTHHLTAEVSYTKQLAYQLYLPPNYRDGGQFPLLLFLHGSGERGWQIERLNKFGPPKQIAQGAELPFIVLCPQCPAEERWEQNERELLMLLDHVQTTHAVDADRVYLTGFSMGAYGAWFMAWKHTMRFAALVTVAGGLRAADVALAVSALKNLPCWVFHGELDTAVPVVASTRLIEAIRAAGGEVRATIYANYGHDAPNAAYNEPELYTWLLRHRRHAG